MFYPEILTTRKQTKDTLNVTSHPLRLSLQCLPVIWHQINSIMVHWSQINGFTQLQQQHNIKLHVSCLLLQRRQSLFGLSQCQSLRILLPEDSGMLIEMTGYATLSSPHPPSSFILPPPAPFSIGKRWTRLIRIFPSPTEEPERVHLIHIVRSHHKRVSS